MKLVIAITCFACAISTAFSQTAPTPPSGLTAVWAEGTSPNRSIVLTWQDNASTETAYMIERKIGAGAWTDLAGASGTSSLAANTVTHTDTTIPRSYTTPYYYYYRVRAKNGTVESGAAEVATLGIPSQWPATNYDSDLDGISDSVETTAGLNPANWEDGTGDADGDLIPNAWEASLGTSITSPNTLSPQVTVDASYTGTDTATLTKTIAAAITKLTTTPSGLYRVILVKPGVYQENLNITSTYQIAFIADRTDPAFKGKECEIRGSTAAPVVACIGSMVFDGFVFTRTGSNPDAAFAYNETTPTTRVSTTRLVNCIVRNMDTGASSVIEQAGGRLVLAHNTFYMNTLSNSSQAHSYTSGVLSGTSPVQSTARLRVRNCIFWNPINTTRPEFQSVGDYQIQTSIVYAQSLSGAASVNPGLTPKGYLMSGTSAAAAGGTTGVQVLRDMHGELRFNPPGRGADDWNDQEGDQIPDFWDTNVTSASNAGADNDADSLTELGEYQASTSLESADSQVLTLEQALRIFTVPHAYLTRDEADGRYMPLNPTTLRKVRVSPGGNISMGEFQ